MRRKALITGAGAAGGIGLATARALGAAGFDLAITATSGRIHARAAELIAEGHSVMGPAATVEEALQVLQRERPDVALLDFNLRGKTALPVAERLNLLGIPAIILSAYEVAQLARFDALASVRYVRKPYGEDELLRTIHAVTSSSASL